MDIVIRGLGAAIATAVFFGVYYHVDALTDTTEKCCPICRNVIESKDGEVIRCQTKKRVFHKKCVMALKNEGQVKCTECGKENW